MEITMEQVMKMGYKNTIDIRSNTLYNKGSLPNAINIPRQVLLLKPELYLKKNTTYYLYCDEGEQSRAVSRELNELGYHTYSIEGGFHAYQK